MEAGEAGQIQLSLKAPKHSLKALKDGWNVLEADNCVTTGEPGQPLLPHQILTVILPADADPKTVSLVVRDVKMSDEAGSFNLPAAQPLQSMRAPKVQPLAAPVGPARVLPVAQVTWTGQLRKWKIAQIDFVPFQYDVATHRMSVVSQATAEIRFSQSADAVATPLMKDTLLDGMLALRAVNADQASAWYPGNTMAMGTAARSKMSARLRGATSGTSPACPADDPWTYVIATTNKIQSSSTALSAFVNHKEESRAHYVKVITESDYGSLTGEAPNGRTEKIRQWLKDNYQTHGIQYVLLIGNPDPTATDAVSVPMKKCYPVLAPLPDSGVPPDCGAAPGSVTTPNCEKEPEAPTDYYFANLSSDWNKSGSADHACEFQGDYRDNVGQPYPSTNPGMKLNPDVVVGRIPFYSDDANGYAELDRVLNKIISYQTAANTAWRRSILLPMSFWGKGADGAEFGEALWNNFLSTEPGFTRYRMYQQGGVACPNLPPSDPTYTNDSVYTSDEELRDDDKVLNHWAANPAGVVAWYGHGAGNRTAIGWGDPAPTPPKAPNDYYDCWMGNILQSGDTTPTNATHLDDGHPAFTFQNSCDNGYPEDTGNIQAALLRWGSIGTVAASRAVFFGGEVYNLFQNQQSSAGIGYEYIYNLTVADQAAGTALYAAKFFAGAENLIDPYGLKLKLTLNLYGDPEVAMVDSSSTAPGSGPYCSGHGKCESSACACRTGYSGADCSVTCPGGPSCSNHGSCEAGACVCQPGYSGADCSTTCPGGPTCSGNGTCDGVSCTCQAGYSGADCSTTCPGGPTCSGHGTCDGVSCTCQAGYSGADCATTCPGGPTCSGHGTCDGVSCTCQTAYTGPDCSVTCPGGTTCSGHGTCTHGVCSCSAGYTGPGCATNCGSSSTCPDGNACSGNMQCASRVCQGGVCQPPGCAPHCNQGAACGANSDCGSQVCTSWVCAPPTCSPRCTQGAVCGLNADCASRVCTNNLCQPPTCAPHCNTGANCGANNDCGSRVCTAGLCAAPACSPNCNSGAACGVNADCKSRVCNGNICR